MFLPTLVWRLCERSILIPVWLLGYPRPDESRGVNASLLQAGILAPRQLGMGGGGGGDAEGEKGEMHWSVNKPEPPGGVGALSST